MKRKNHLRLKTVLTAFLLTFFMFSCQKEELNLNEQEFFQAENNQKETILGGKLENPYSVENMQKAYENLVSGYTHQDLFEAYYWN